MMRRLYTPRYAYASELDQRRASGLQLLALILLVLLTGLIARLVLAQTGLIAPTGAAIDATLIWVLPGIAVGMIVTYALIQHGWLNWASALFTGLLLLGTLALVTIYDFGPIYLVVPLIAAGSLLGRRGLIITMLLVIIELLLRYSAVSQMDTAIRVVPSRDIASATLQAFIILTFMFALLYIFGGVNSAISQRSIRHVQRLTAINELTPQFAAETSESRLINSALLIAQNDLGYALAQLYVIDASGHITRRLRQGSSVDDLIASAGANTDEASVVADAAQSHEPVRTTIKDSVLRNQHLIAPSRSAVSLPIIFADGRAAAVLDVQSVSPDEASAEELAELTALAQSFAAAWEKLALTSDQARIIADQSGQIERLREQVNTFEGRSRQTVTSGWESYLRGRGEDSIGFDLIRQQHGLSERDLRPASDLPPEMRTALERGEPLITHGEEGEQIIHMPIHVRDAMLGAMLFRVPAGQPITQRQMETVRIVAERLGLALESTRLYEQVQSQARRESKASEVTGVLLGTTDLNTLLDAAAGTFNEALGAVYTRVTIEPAALAQPGTRPVANGQHSPASKGGN